MKILPVLVTALIAAVGTRAQVTLKEIRTASDTTLVAVFESRNVTGPVWNRVNQTNEINTADVSAWKLNGQPVSAIDQFVTPSEFCDYHIYLHVAKLVNGAAYKLETPHGNTNFVFNDRTTLCESIKLRSEERRVGKECRSRW